MNGYELLGWTANALFFARFLVQWLASERAGMAIYTGHRGEPVLMVGVLANALLYARNLMLRAAREGGRRVPAPLLLLLAVPLVALLFWTGLAKARAGLTSEHLWLGVVLFGQGLWSSRFVIQWWSSERRGASHFPLVFWWVSLAGNLLLLAYNLHLGDPVLVAGFVFGPFVQIRNIVLILRPSAVATPRDSPARAG